MSVPGALGSDHRFVRRVHARTGDGVDLTIHCFDAVVQRRAVCLCGHAMMTGSRYFYSGGSGFAAYLAARGISVYVLDWRGHGDSVPPDPHHQPGWCFDDYVQQDLPACIERVCSDAGVGPGELCYLGHSLGGSVALAALGTGAIPSVRRLSLWATSLWLPGPRGSVLKRGLLRAGALISRSVGYAPIAFLRLGTKDELVPYVEQLASWASTGKWTSRSGINYLERLGDIDLDTWVVTGDGDRLCRPVDADRFRRRLPRARAMRVVGRRFGDAIDADHFTLFTRDSLAPLWEELVTFLVED